MKCRCIGLLVVGLVMSVGVGCMTSENETQTSISESIEQSEEGFSHSSIKNTEQVGQSDVPNIPSINSDEQITFVGHNNHFTVTYDDSVFYMDSDGIHRLFPDGKDELFYIVDVGGINLFYYENRLYYYGSDSKIYSIGIDDGNKTMIGEGGVSCDFYKDYLFTYIPGDLTKGREYVGYKIDPATGERIDNKTYTILDLLEIDGAGSVIMSQYSDISYKDKNSQIYAQKINVLNPMVSYEKFGGIYCYDIDAEGNVSLEFESEKQNKEVVFWEKGMKSILLDDLEPIWSALAVDSGIFYTDISSYAENVFPIYYSDTDGNSMELMKKENESVGMRMNFDGEWLYYTASESDDEAVAACYRVNIHTLENQQLYTSGSIDLLHQLNTMDIQGDLFFYYDTTDGEVNIINMNE